MKRFDVIASALALGLSVVAVVVLVALPCIQMVESTRSPISSVGGESVPGEVHQSRCRSLTESTGYRVLFLLLIPVVLTSANLLATVRRWKMVAALVVGLLSLFFLLTGFSIGLFFGPAAAAGVVSLALLLTSKAL